MSHTDTAFQFGQRSSMLSHINNLIMSAATGNDDYGTNKHQNSMALIHIQIHKPILKHTIFFVKYIILLFTTSRVYRPCNIISYGPNLLYYQSSV